MSGALQPSKHMLVVCGWECCMHAASHHQRTCSSCRLTFHSCRRPSTLRFSTMHTRWPLSCTGCGHAASAQVCRAVRLVCTWDGEGDRPAVLALRAGPTSLHTQPHQNLGLPGSGAGAACGSQQGHSLQVHSSLPAPSHTIFNIIGIIFTMSSRAWAQEAAPPASKPPRPSRTSVRPLRHPGWIE